ncbi:MAG: hypothetical protein ACLQVI_39265 [Polyangiaceae bacterium]|jgi:hypothetical protein
MTRSRMTPLFPFLGLVALAPFGVVLACGGSEPPPAVSPPTTSSGAPSGSVAVTNSTPSTASASASASAPAPAPLPAASVAALAAILTTDPAELAAIASAAASASPAKTQPASAAGDLAKGLTAIAIKAAPGMKPDGAVATGVLKEGGHLGWSVTLAPGKCYAIIGYSPTGQIQDLDLHVLSPPFFTMLAGEDTTDDNAPVVGSAPNPMCPVVSVQMPYKVDITAQKGAGHAAVQLFSKAN